MKNIARRIGSITIVIAILIFAVLPSFATESEPIVSEHFAQVYHSVGVDEYGSNIYDCSVFTPNVPAEIQQDQEKLMIKTELDGTPLTIEALVQSKSETGNLLYFDAMCDRDDMEVMSLTYNRNFVPAAAITLDQQERFPEAENLLKVYLKVLNTNSGEREYYFLEFFDFELEDFEKLSNKSSVGKADFWNMREFLPIERTIEKSDVAMQSNVSSDSEEYIIKDSYYNVNVLQYAAVQLTQFDDVRDVPVGGETHYGHRLELSKKFTECPSIPDYDVQDSYMSIKAGELSVNAPLGAAYFSTTIDGQVYKPTNPFSASISVGIGPLSVSMDLGDIIKPAGKVDINDTYKSYVNDMSTGKMTRGIKVDFDATLMNVGDFYFVDNLVRDYGETRTDSSMVYASWMLTVWNQGSHREFTYATLRDWPLRVG